MTLVKTWIAWPRLQRGKELAYARRILVNASTDSCRRRRRERLVPDVEPSAGPDGQGNTDDRDQICRLLRRLPQAQRKVVVLRYYADLPEREVAELLGICVGAVKSQASRGLATLRSLVATAEEVRS